MIILLGGVSARYISALKSDTENILEANYNTLLYTRNMLIALENPNQEGLVEFEQNLILQKTNMTEIGEKEATHDVDNNFQRLKTEGYSIPVITEIRKDIYHLMELNMHAIQRKSKVATVTADAAFLWIAITGTFCFVIAFLLLIKLPSNIANPIQELTSSIQQIAAKNYSERVNLESHSEFGQLAKSFNTMAIKLEEYNHSNLAKLMMEKKRIEALINNMRDPVIGLDEEMKIIFANQQALKVTGMNEQAMIGHDAMELAVKNDLIRLLIQDLIPTEGVPVVKAQPIKIYTEQKEGYFEKETLHIVIEPTHEQTQRVVGHVIVLKNITAYKELDFAKTNFIANISHEFKTPISAIKMSLQLLENKQIGTLNPEQSNLLESIKDDANRLLKITGELLNMTQVESGNIQLTIMPADPKEMFLYAINATRPQAEQKQIKLDMHCPANIPKVQADSEKTAWVLTNLISNAIRYSYDNSTITLLAKQLGGMVELSVKDTGQGIPPQYKDKIFDRYFQVPGSSKEGTGLGLAISKEFIEAQGGHISVVSDLGAGSTFVVQLGAEV